MRELGRLDQFAPTRQWPPDKAKPRRMRPGLRGAHRSFCLDEESVAGAFLRSDRACRQRFPSIAQMVRPLTAAPATVDCRLPRRHCTQ